MHACRDRTNWQICNTAIIAASSRISRQKLLKLSGKCHDKSCVAQAKQEEAQRRAAEEMRRREEAMKRKEDEAAARRYLQSRKKSLPP